MKQRRVYNAGRTLISHLVDGKEPAAPPPNQISTINRQWQGDLFLITTFSLIRFCFIAQRIANPDLSSPHGAFQERGGAWDGLLPEMSSTVMSNGW